MLTRCLFWRDVTVHLSFWNFLCDWPSVDPDLSTAPYDQKDLCVCCRTYTLTTKTAGPLKRPSSSTIASLHDIISHRHITPLLASLHWLKIKERIEYKLLSLTYKILTTSPATYLHNLVSLQPSPVRHLSPFATLSRPESRNARNLVSWFSEKLLKLLPPDVGF